MSSFTVPHNGFLTEGDFRRVLLIRLSSLGDILLMTPVLSLLRANCPQAQIDVLTKSAYRDLLRAHPDIARLLTFDPRQSVLRSLRHLVAERYDLALDLHHTVRSQLFLRVVRARRKLTYNKRVLRRALLVHLGWNTLRSMTPVPELYAAPLRRLGLKGQLGSPTMYLDLQSTEAMEAHIARCLPDAFNRPLLAIAPGARWPTKRWPAERFAAVAQELARERGAIVVILGGADEAHLASAFMRQSRSARLKRCRQPVAHAQRGAVEPLSPADQQRLRSHAHGDCPSGAGCRDFRSYRAGIRLLPLSGTR